MDNANDNLKKAIVILSAGIKKNKDEKWESSALIESDDFQGGLGGKERVTAASILYHQSPQTIVTTGGRGGDKNIAGVEHPDISNIVKGELVSLGVDEKDIIEENKSNKTFDCLMAIKEIIKNNHFESVSLISSQHHLPRVRAMMELDGELNNGLQAGAIKLVCAEEILIDSEPDKWRRYFNEAYKSNALQKLIALEAQGIEQIKKGTYKLR